MEIDLAKLAMQYGDSLAVLAGAIAINRYMIKSLQKEHDEEKKTNEEFRKYMYNKERELLKCNGEIKTSIAVIQEKQSSQDDKIDNLTNMSEKILSAITGAKK